MSTTISLIKTIPLIRESQYRSLKWNPCFQPSSTRFPLQPIKINKNSTKNTLFSVKGLNFRVNSVLPFCEDRDIITKSDDKEKDFLVKRVAEVILKALQKPVLIAILLAVLLTYVPHSALAYSGGTMGGSSSGDEYSDFNYSSSDLSDFDYSPSPSDNYRSLSSTSSSSISSESKFIVFGISTVLIVFFILVGSSSILEKTTVIKLQVCLFRTTRSLQKELDQIAESTDTSTSKGWKHILKETTSSLIQLQDCWTAVHSSVVVKDATEAKTLYSRLSLEERSKFEKDTLFNVNGVERKEEPEPKENGVSSEYLVVTILVRLRGEETLPTINSKENLMKALERLNSAPSIFIKAVQVLWAPQKQNDTLSEEELRENYPLLVDLPRPHGNEPGNVASV